MAQSKDTPLSFESELFKKQQTLSQLIVLGVDEVGRGALAGPIVAASVALTPHAPLHPKVRDSKQCSPQEREELYHWIREHHHVQLAALSASEIDRWGISYCNQEIMRRCLYAQVDWKGEKRILKTLIDGRLKFKLPSYFNAQWMVKGDTISYAIASASIVAKHVRDYIMRRLARTHSLYGLEEHKGYGTQQHLTQLKIHGVSSIHRRTFCQTLFHYQNQLL